MATENTESTDPLTTPMTLGLPSPPSSMAQHRASERKLGWTEKKKVARGLWVGFPCFPCFPWLSMTGKPLTDVARRH